MLQNLENSRKLAHASLHVQCCLSKTRPQEKTSSMIKSSMDLYSTKAACVTSSPSWYSPVQVPQAISLITLLTKLHHYNSQRYTVLWGPTAANWTVFLCQQMTVQNGMRTYRLVFKQTDNKKWPRHTGHERVQLLTFLASKENKIHKNYQHTQVSSTKAARCSEGWRELPHLCSQCWCNHTKISPSCPGWKQGG